MNFYRLLRDNKELGPFSLQDIRKLGLQSSDLIWVDGESAAWRFPDEVPGLLSLIENAGIEITDPNKTENENSIASKPKKRYRLTADHRMVEITEEEARSSDILRVEEQPPAPKEEIVSPPNTDDYTPFVDVRKDENISEKDESFPLEPELKDTSVNNSNDDDSFPLAPFSKKTMAPPQESSPNFPLEPELSKKASKEDKIEEFADVDLDKNDPMSQENNTPSNTGAFVLAGLLFLVAIGFFGYKWYQDQQDPQNAQSQNMDGNASVDSTTNTHDSPNGFANSKSIALNDDTLGQQQRLANLRSQDSVKRIAELAKAKLAARAKAKADSLQLATDMQLGTDNLPDENNIGDKTESTTALPKKDTAKENKVNKIRTTDDIGKYVRVGVVQPKNQTNGVAGVKLVVHNINNRNLAKVHINVMYFDNNGNILKKADIIAPNITIGNSVTIPVSDNSKAAYVSYKVTGLLGDHVNLQAK